MTYGIADINEVYGVIFVVLSVCVFSLSSCVLSSSLLFVDEVECYSGCGIRLRCCRLRYHSLSRIAITLSRAGCIYFFNYLVAMRLKSSVNGNEIGLRIFAFFCVSIRHEKRTRWTKTYYGNDAIRLTRWCTTPFSFVLMLSLTTTLLLSVVVVLFA